jgi:hypothetical protein
VRELHVGWWGRLGLRNCIWLGASWGWAGLLCWMMEMRWDKEVEEESVYIHF